MFISVSQLESEMGVDKRIGRFFVDRRIPENNSFWKGRLLYIAFGNGYLFIPVYYDILYRIGLPLEDLLNEKHICFMEQLMHFATLQEINKILFTEELESIRGLLEGRVHDSENYAALSRYLDQPKLHQLDPFGLPFPSLNRADVFLYILCDIPMSKGQLGNAIRYWYALLPTYLILDDIRDFEEDLKSGEENVLVDLGSGTEAFEKTFEMFQKNCATLDKLNPVLATFLLKYGGELRGKAPAKG